MRSLIPPSERLSARSDTQIRAHFLAAGTIRTRADQASRQLLRAITGANTTHKERLLALTYACTGLEEVITAARKLHAEIQVTRREEEDSENSTEERSASLNVPAQQESKPHTNRTARQERT